MTISNHFGKVIIACALLTFKPLVHTDIECLALFKICLT